VGRPSRHRDGADDGDAFDAWRSQRCGPEPVACPACIGAIPPNLAPACLRGSCEVVGGATDPGLIREPQSGPAALGATDPGLIREPQSGPAALKGRVNVAFVVAESVAGFLAGSTALLAEAPVMPGLGRAGPVASRVGGVMRAARLVQTIALACAGCGGGGDEGSAGAPV